MTFGIKIATRVMLLGLVPLGLLVVVLLASFYAANEKDQLFNRLYSEHLVILADVMHTQKILQQQGLAELQQYRTGWASAEATHTKVTTLLQQAELHWQQFQAQRVVGSEETAAAFTELDQTFARALKHYQDWIGYVGTDALLVRILNESTISNEVKQQIQPFTDLADQFIQQQIATAAKVRDQATALTQLMLQVYVLGGLLLALLILGLIWRTRRAVNLPLRQLRDLLLRLEQDADLTLRANAKGQDEIAEAATALNRMLQRFAALLQQLGVSAAQLSQQATEVSAFGEQVKGGAAEQAQQADQLALAAAEMQQALQQVTAQTQAATETAQMATERCADGRQVSQASMQSAEQLAAELAQSAQLTAALQQDSAKISGVLEVIGKISEQTNLLALNAAIEAARAGEAGRGFSVVADEVRTLSANTKAATESIRQMIVSLQQQADKALTGISAADQKALRSVQLARQTEQMFGELANEVTALHNFNARIVSASAEQQQLAARFNQGINRLHDASQQLHQGTAASAQASEQLSAVAAQLEQGWRSFKVV